MKRLWMVGAMIWATSLSAAEPNRGVDLASCHIKNHSQEVLCGTHAVFEDRFAA